MSTTATPLLPGNWYHIYNRGVDGRQLFFEERNYPFFLELLAKHVLPVAAVYAYCLLNNHFHLLTRILEQPGKKPHLGFSHLFNSYAQAINKQYLRSGSLFERPFKRKLITSEAYLWRVLIYIHHNPVHHNLCDDFSNYRHSSYHAILADGNTHLQRAEVLAWFDGHKGFIESHLAEFDSDAIKDYVIE